MSQVCTYRAPNGVNVVDSKHELFRGGRPVRPCERTALARPCGAVSDNIPTRLVLGKSKYARSGKGDP
jgi:hypothetical protein